jgi:carboxymethylenebutenolidase
MITIEVAEPGIDVSLLHVPADGFDVVAFVAKPEGEGPFPVLFVIPENPGLVKGRQEETLRQVKELGAAVVVLSPYSRLGGSPPPGPWESQDQRRRANFLAMPDEQVADDLDLLVTWVLDNEPWADPKRAALLGYCSGGGQAFYAVATRKIPVRCLVAIYGNILLRGDFTADWQPIDRIPMASKVDLPFQGHFGSLDHEIGPEQVARLDAELERAGKDYVIYNYEGAGHVFADPNHPNHHPEATKLLWERTYAFLHRFLDEPAS